MSNCNKTARQDTRMNHSDDISQFDSDYLSYRRLDKRVKPPPDSNEDTSNRTDYHQQNQDKMLNLGVVFPDFEVNTTLGKFSLHSFLANSWALICSHPADFTPVCTTEIARMAQLVKETDKRNVKVCFLSCDPVESHKKWVKDIESYSGCKVPFPIIDDDNNKISAAVGMNEEGLDKFQTVRGVFVLDPSKKVRATICYPASVGRNFDEIIRLVDALQLTSQNNEIVTPAGWKQGDEVLVKPGCEGTGARVVDLPSQQPYLRFTKC